MELNQAELNPGNKTRIIKSNETTNKELISIRLFKQIFPLRRITIVDLKKRVW